MQHIVLDTNSLIMAISSRNRYHKVWQAFLKGGTPARLVRQQ